MRAFPFGCVLLLAACASSDAAPVAQPNLLSVQLNLVPAPKGEWSLAAKNESGFEVQQTGNGDTIDLRLPPGPCSLRLVADGLVYERPIVLGSVGANELWRLVGGRRQ